MRRSVMTGAVLTVGTVLGVLTPVAGSTAAWANGPRYVTSTMTFDNVFPAGTICDFDFRNVLTVSDSAAIFPDRMIDYFVTQATDTNLALVSRWLRPTTSRWSPLRTDGRSGRADVTAWRFLAARRRSTLPPTVHQ